METPSYWRPLVPLSAALALLLPLGTPLAAQAQDAGPGVARISYAQGGVAVQRADSSSPTNAVVNAPVEAGDYVTTGNAGRGEIAFDHGSDMRLGGDVQMRMVNVSPNDHEVQLAQGTVDMRALPGSNAADQIDTPSVSIRPHGASSVRVNVDSHGVTHVTPRDGSADVVTPGGTRTIAAGQTLLAHGPAGDPSVQTAGAPAYDAFDTFDNDRDRYEESPGVAASDAYVDQDIVGVDDLGPYGHWYDDPTYGEVWVPADEPSDWAPYQDGQWVWEDGYGWTWVSSDPWGWAPYHYGSWYRSPWGWAWYPPRPGPDYPTWQPALVAFVGFGGGVGVSLDFGDPNFDLGLDIGWVPLAPYEPYYPWWGPGGYSSITYVNSYNAYQNYAYGSYVSGRNFYGGRFGRAMRVGPSMYGRAHVFQGRTPFVPTAANLRYSRASVARSLDPRPALMRGTYAGDPRVATARTPFAQQRAAAARFSRAPAHAVAASSFRTRTVAARTAAARAGTIHLANNRATGARPMAARPAAGARPTAARATANRGAANRGTAHRAPVTANRAAPNRAANPAWSRFNTNRGTHVAAGRAARPATANRATANRAIANHAPANRATVNRGATRPVAAHRGTGVRTAARPATRTAARPAARAAARPVSVSHAATGRTAPARTYARTYAAPRAAAPARAAAPHYAAPARAAAPHYAAPARAAAPHYAAPARPAMPAARPAAPRAAPAPQRQQHPPR